jgi:hypothetical protein
VNLSGVRPGSEAGHGVELLEQAADDFVGICMGTQAIKLAQHARQRFFNFADRVLGIELTLLIEAALALDEFFPVKVREIRFRDAGIISGVSRLTGFGSQQALERELRAETTERPGASFQKHSPVGFLSV